MAEEGDINSEGEVGRQEGLPGEEHLRWQPQQTQLPLKGTVTWQGLSPLSYYCGYCGTCWMSTHNSYFAIF